MHASIASALGAAWRAHSTTFLYGKDGSEIATTRKWVSVHCAPSLLARRRPPLLHSYHSKCVLVHELHNHNACMHPSELQSISSDLYHVV